MTEETPPSTPVAEAPVSGSPAPVAKRPRRRVRLAVLILAGIVLVVLYFLTGFYTVQPIGALPDGITLFVWRTGGEPFFNSPDGHCLRVVGEVSLLCRGLAMEQAPADRIIVRLPYWEWAYLRSTGGQSFNR